MKKLLLFIALCLLLGGCGERNEVIENRNINTDEIPSDVVFYASYILTERPGFYYIGTGITVNNLSDEGKVLDYVSTVYPIYDDDKLLCLIVDTNGEQELFERSMVRTSLENDEKYIIIRNNGILAKISEEGEYVISGDNGIILDGRVVKKVRKSIKKTNDLGKQRKQIKSENDVTDPSTGKKYSSSRIVVKFTEGESDSKIADFELFCEGKLKSQIKSAGIYVFEIEPSSYRKLNSLVKAAKDLDYVENAYLDEQRDMDPSVKPADQDR